jgi:hypothetical protein
VQTSTQPEQKVSASRDAVGLACFRARELRDIAARIENAVAGRSVERAEAGRFAGLCADEAEALGAATLMRQCGHVDNVWHGEQLSNDAGDRFEGFGVLYGCNVRLCPYCMNARRRVSRARARDGMKRAGLSNGEKWFLVTLTMPTLPANQASLFETMRVVYEAWGAFTKRGTWESLARASIKGVEFTLGQRHKDEGRDWTPERDGYHVHIHLLAVARWIDVATLRREWSRCIKQAWEAHGIEQGINTRDGLAVCHARIVTNRKVKKSGSVISYEGALSEVSKYITKAESFLTIPAEQLIDVACVRRWPRMFELLGGCRAPRSKKGQPEQPASAEGAADYLDTENLSSARDELRRQMKEALRAARPRSVPLRQRSFESLMCGEWEKWSDELAEHVSAVRSYRRLMLSRRFPCATFRTLAGGLWYGSEANPAGAFEAEALHEHRAALADYMSDRRTEVEEGAAVEADQWEASMVERRGIEFKAGVRDADERDRNEWVNEPITKIEMQWVIRDGKETLTPEEKIDRAATNKQRGRREQLHRRYKDAEHIRRILFIQGRQAEWVYWITHPGSPMPDVRPKK